MSARKGVSIRIVLNNARMLGSFFGALRGSRLSSHIKGPVPVEVVIDDSGYGVTARFDEYATLDTDINRLFHFWNGLKVTELN
ncbi:MAG: hypothetical protein HZB10_01615 [Candidatus Yonathbacteria bacterium]|nr:hypothetical protein [Candidatus Yonathbacteria bacterium]